MAERARVRVYCACSLDGFLAGEGDDLSWLPGSGTDADVEATGEAGDPAAVTYEEFTGEVGAMLMGRRTYDVVAGFEGPWPYGETPVLVATRRDLSKPPPTVRAVSGEIAAMIQQALEAAGGKDVYLDGGDLIRQGLEVGLVDELIVTMVATVLGKGIPLFAGVSQRHNFEFTEVVRYPGGMAQLHLRPMK